MCATLFSFLLLQCYNPRIFNTSAKVCSYELRTLLTIIDLNQISIVTLDAQICSVFNFYFAMNQLNFSCNN